MTQVVDPTRDGNLPGRSPKTPVVNVARGVAAADPRSGVERRLFEKGYAFDFFQAVRLMHWTDPGRVPVGRGGPARKEIVRFRSRVSLSFPPSSIYEIQAASDEVPVPVMIQAFLGLIGVNGTLPRHYTELLSRLERDVRGPERYALRDWLDLFNHRFVSLFYRAWEKYRFFLAFERGDAYRVEPDSFTTSLYSLIGLGSPALRGRLRVNQRGVEDGRPKERVLARIEDLTLLHFGGLFGHRPRCAVALEAILRDYFRLAAEVRQFQGQWLPLSAANQTRLGENGGNNLLGVSTIVGERVWDLQTKFRVRLGPLRYTQFLEFLPDTAAGSQRKAFFLLVHLVRLYVGPELDFDVQLVLDKAEIPHCRLTDEGPAEPARLGWNMWLRGDAAHHDAEDAVFEGCEVSWLDGALNDDDRGEMGRSLFAKLA